MVIIFKMHMKIVINFVLKVGMVIHFLIQVGKILTLLNAGMEWCSVCSCRWQV